MDKLSAFGACIVGQCEESNLDLFIYLKCSQLYYWWDTRCVSDNHIGQKCSKPWTTDVMHVHHAF